MLPYFFEKKCEGKTSIWTLETESKTKAAPKDDWLLKNWDVDCCSKHHCLVVKKQLEVFTVTVVLSYVEFYTAEFSEIVQILFPNYFYLVLFY